MTFASQSSARWEPEPPTCVALLPNWVDTVIVPAQTLYVPVIERPSTSIVTECWLRMTPFGGSLMQSWLYAGRSKHCQDHGDGDQAHCHAKHGAEHHVLPVL